MVVNKLDEKEYRSSGWALVLVGGIGFVIVLLGATGVIPFQFEYPYIFYGVMFSFFALLFVMGLLSFKNARIFEAKTKAENSLMDTVAKWCEENLTKEQVDAVVAKLSEGEDDLYFERVAYIRGRINCQFINLDQELLDQFIDEELYAKLFEEDV